MTHIYLNFSVDMEESFKWNYTIQLSNCFHVFSLFTSDEILSCWINSWHCAVQSINSLMMRRSIRVHVLLTSKYLERLRQLHANHRFDEEWLHFPGSCGPRPTTHRQLQAPQAGKTVPSRGYKATPRDSSIGFGTTRPIHDHHHWTEAIAI